MKLTEHHAVREYARMMNTRSLEQFEALLAADSVLKAQVQAEPVQGRQQVLEFLAKVLDRVADDAPLWAEMGEIRLCGRARPCAVLSQYTRANRVVYVTADIEGDQITRLSLAFLSDPQEVRFTGETPR